VTTRVTTCESPATGANGHERCTHSRYSLNCEEFDVLLDRSGNRCEICRVHASEVAGGQLEIDHDPRYGSQAVRGLLCGKCNCLVRDVDLGTKFDERVIAYWENAWFLQVIRCRRPQMTAYWTRRYAGLEPQDPSVYTPKRRPT
jgi:hypothetical protein